MKLIIVATLLLALMAPQPAMAQSTNSTAAQVATLRHPLGSVAGQEIMPALVQRPDPLRHQVRPGGACLDDARRGLTFRCTTFIETYLQR